MRRLAGAALLAAGAALAQTPNERLLEAIQGGKEPVAAILVWTLPNLLAFPWTYPDYYRRVLDSALFSFPVSIALCVLIARRLFGASPVDRGAASAGHEMP